MSKRFTIGTIIGCVLLISLIFVVGFSSTKYSGATQKLYKVYLDGTELGMIENKNELYALIDQEQQDIKEKYDVTTIYPPKGLEVSEVLTYDKNIISVNEIYNKIKDEETFTIEGYQINIVNEEKKINITINVLEKKFFEEAINNIVKSFYGEEEYIAYIEETQIEIKDIGEKIDKIYIDDNITIKKTLISTEEYIFTSTDDLTKYLLFGTLEDQKKYTVKYGDTLEDISNKNELNVEELLIANSDIVSKNILLYKGQVLNIGLINPQVNIVAETTSIEDAKIKYDTTVQYDNSLDASIKYVKQNGVNGLSRVTYKNKIVNGEILSVVQISVEEITQAVNKIIVIGGSNAIYVGDSDWAWPTTKPYKISSPYGWRWGSLHRGVDITSSGYGSPIYAIQSGTVVKSEYDKYSMGNYVIINHGNGYKSYYFHMSKRLVSTGDSVIIGQTIGLMGSTGYSTGTHLHLGVSYNGAYFNPLKLYD